MRQSERAEREQRLSVGMRVEDALNRWPHVRMAGVAFSILVVMLLIQNSLLSLTAVSLRFAIVPGRGVLSIDGQTLTLPIQQQPSAVVFAATDPLTREFQLDGSDSTNNFSLDLAYLARIAATPYYRFQAWMRNSSSYSSWRDVRDNGSTISARPDGSALVTFASGNSLSLSANLLRPETPAHIYLQCGENVCGEIIINRNDRYVLAHNVSADGAVSGEQRIYFPENPWPFVAEVLYLLTQVAIWSLTLLLLALAISVALGAAAPFAGRAFAGRAGRGRAMITFRANALAQSLAHRLPARIAALVRQVARDRWDALALLTVLGSFGYVLWVAMAEYQGQPHILDASAYLFQAKIFASGHLSAPAPADLGAFQGPFMVVRDGRWFAQYPPMTSLLLAVGVVARAPWLVEPLLGTLALWGIFRLGRHFYGGAVAWLAVLLGALSPFYTYLAASYMSHTVALFFAVYFLLMLVRFTSGWRWYDLALAAIFAVGLLFTREFSAVVVGIVASVFLFASQWRALRERAVAIWPAFFVAVAIIASGLMLYLLYNQLQTGSATVSPRMLFFPGDRYGFGQGIGFYGQHTFAAGMVILDQLLTILLIDLYGWPFYLTLAFLPLTFFRRDAGSRWDVFCALLLVVLVGAQAGYFYHGIYLGPRYLFETLPFLLLLTARGVTGLVAALTHVVSPFGATFPASRLAMGVSGLLLALLLACNLFYYSPRQALLYHGYTGLPGVMKVDARVIYAFHPQQAIVLTSDWYVYNYILWPLNDPALRGETIYAYLSTPDVLQRLRHEYPNRTFFLAEVAPGGSVTFARI